MVFDEEGFKEFTLENKVVGFGPVTLSSERESNWYANWRRISNDVYLMDKLTDYVISFVKHIELNPSTFYGVPDGATKLGVLTQDKWAKRSRDYGIGSHIISMGRKQEKKVGDPADKYFIGFPRAPVILLEDVTTTASSLQNEAVKIFESCQSGSYPLVIAAISLLDRSEGEARARMNRLDIDFYSILSARNILPEAFRRANPGKDIADKIRKEYEDLGLPPINLS